MTGNLSDDDDNKMMMMESLYWCLGRAATLNLIRLNFLRDHAS